MRKIGSKILTFFIFLLLFSVAVFLIGTGLRYYKMSQKEYAFHKLIDELFLKANSIFSVNQDYLLGDSFQIEGNVDVDIYSEYYEKNKSEDELYAKRDNLFKNVSLLEINYNIAQDRTKKEFYTYINATNNNDKTFLNKRLIKNSTEYLFYNDVNEQYINNGKNTYFESFNEEITTVDNIEYLYNFIKESLKKHITNDELELYETSTYVGEQEQQVNQISYRLTDDSLKKLYKSIIKDIKKDDRAKDIMSLIYSDFDNYKINEKKKIIPKGETYVFNIYVSRRYYDILKYEVVKTKANHQEIYSYEGDFDDGDFFYIVDNEVIYRASYKAAKKKFDIEVYDRSDKSVGTIHGEKDKNTKTFNLTLNLDDKKYDVTYHDNNTDLSDDGFNKIITMSFKIMDQLINIVEGNVKIDAKMVKSASIDEDVSNAILRVGFSEEEEEKFKTYYDSIIERLET